jgi:4-hydroxybenzoyl-CoA thioesterase/acyl-CoA thioester hydrolase
MSKTFSIKRRVEFRETDTAGIVHFSNFFAYMEQAEHELLRHVGMGVICEIDGQPISFPRVNAECNYRLAIRFEDVIDIHVSVKRIGSKSITYGFAFQLDGNAVADGTITVVCCKFEHGKKPVAIETPQKFIDAITPWLESNAESGVRNVES